MNWFIKYKAYLQDNPEGYWFKRKIWGWGWTPATWQGWTVVIAALAAIAYLALRAEAVPPGYLAGQVVIPIIVVLIILGVVSYWKGEPPQWQWGLKDSSPKNGTDTLNLP